ncbi:MAG: sugar transferase [Bacilli bacterium]|nr:sugar transferase [Bacilli bacterium]
MNELEYSIESVSARSVSLSIKRNLYLFIKRGFDIVLSLVGCLIILPLMCIVKICNICTKDFSSVFYKQKRIGKNGKFIYIYKFRTMVPNADEVLKELLKKSRYKKQWKKNQKLDNDPRITKIGKLLRKSSLDEIPQFINVLKGDMSIIGPRPLVEGELDEHGGDHELYESVRPGITGWWACHGRSATTYEERLDLEYYYIKRQGLKIDIKCIIQTIMVVLGCKGAK